MRREFEIVSKQASVYAELEATKTKYNALGQIDALSGEGNELSAKINNLKGQLVILAWMTAQSYEI